MSVTQSVPAPVGGVNARDSLALMPATDAVVMDNWFPYPSYVAVRNGSQSWATGLPAAVETVMAFNGLTTRKLFAWSNGNLYDTTSQGAVGAALISGASTSRWQHAMFNAGGGNVLICVSGGDAPQRYDGNTQGGVATTKSLVGGSGYGNNTYTAVPLTGGTGSGAKATIIVSGGAVVSVSITTAGSGYLVGDSLSASNANLGGTGSGFSIVVETVGGWSVTNLSGPSSVNNLITVTAYKARLWFLENNTMNVWFTATNAYQGPLTQLPLGQIFRLGGTLQAMAAWSVDNVAGMDDYAAFITTEGEVAIYQGYDPNQLSTWSLVGVFRIGRPIGRRCWVKIGSDVAVITADGLTPLSKAMLTDRSQPDAELTYKIVNAINQDVQNYSGNFGWQVMLHPLGNKLIVNVPEVTNSTMHQWVMNTITRAWCRFKNWNANCWEVQQDSLYYGGNQAVYLADSNTGTDAGGAITCDCKPAFSYFEMQGKVKQFLMARPIFQSSNAIQPTIVMNIDFNDVPATPVTFTSGGSSPWDTSPWDVTPWGGLSPSITVKNWIGVTGLGYVASGRISLQLSGIALQWFSTDYMLEPGGAL